ncbi:MAG: hypothetical protein LOD91_05205 [Limnochordales bacterium]
MVLVTAALGIAALVGWCLAARPAAGGTKASPVHGTAAGPGWTMGDGSEGEAPPRRGKSHRFPDGPVAVRFLVVSMAKEESGGPAPEAAPGAAGAPGPGGDGPAVVALFEGGAVRLFLPDGRVVDLPQGRAGRRGVPYADGAVVFVDRGRVADLVLDGVRYRLRAVEQVTDPWERARLAGVNFRGIGQEPGWLVEIRDGKRIDLLLDYGDTWLATPVSWPEIAPDGVIIYRAREWSPIPLQVTIRPGLCLDGMSGEPFPASVAVALGQGGRTYHGCGRWLVPGAVPSGAE